MNEGGNIYIYVCNKSDHTCAQKWSIVHKAKSYRQLTVECGFKKEIIAPM